MLNRVSVMGRLVRDPELRRTQSGKAVVSIRIACDRDFKTAEGSRQADFLDVTAWQNTAEFISRYFTKGRMIIVDGRLQVREWTDKDGNRRNSVEIIADSVYFGDSRPAQTAPVTSGGVPVNPDTGEMMELEGAETGDMPF